MKTKLVEFPSGYNLNVLEHRVAFNKKSFAEEEKEYIEELLNTISPVDVVFGVGAMYGEFEALVASVIGGERLHLFEPTPVHWPSIKATWEANKLEIPYCFEGFVSDKSQNHSKSIYLNAWPKSALGSIQIEPNFSTIYERPDIPSISIDDYISIVGIIPTIIMMDIEGAELLALEGAENTLINNSIIVFTSLHPDFMHHYGYNVEHLYYFMNKIGYKDKYISTDHEIHVVWKKL